MELTINQKPSPERYVLEVAGEVDISNADKLREAVDMALEQPTEQVVLDFSDVAYIDSTGVGVLVGAAHRADDRGRAFSIEHAQPGVMRVAKLLGVDREISITAL